MSTSTRKTKIFPIAKARRVVLNKQAPSDLQVSSSRSKTQSEFNINSADPELLRLHTNITEKIESRGKQKEQMNDLNERLADYIEKVRFLDAQNRRLNRELDVLRERYGRETDLVRARYQCELSNLQNLASESESEKATVEEKLREVQNNLSEQEESLKEVEAENARNREVKERLNQQLADMEGEIALLKRRTAAFDDIKNRNKKELNRLRSEENRLKKDLEQEVQGKFRVDLEGNLLKDVLEATESAHLLKWQELANEVYKDSTEENREAWKSEFKQNLKRIQTQYEDKVSDVTEEVKESLTLKLTQNAGAANRDQFEISMTKSEINTLASRLAELQKRINAIQFTIEQSQSEISTLELEISNAQSGNSAELAELRLSLEERRSECATAKAELQKFFDMKLSTEIELSMYKQLLESESVSGTIDFVDAGKFQLFSETTSVKPKYFCLNRGGYIGGN